MTTVPPHHGAERAALGALAITCVLALAKVAVWAATGSLAVLSQALDSVLDIVALGLAFLGVRIAGKPADSEHHYGHGKAENLAAFAQVVLLGVVVLGVVSGAIANLAAGTTQTRAPWYAFAMLAISAVVDLFRVRLLTNAARRHSSDALRAGALNIATDLGTAAVVFVSLLIVRGGGDWADAAGGLIVAAAVGVAAVRLGKRSVDVLMDRTPSGIEQIASAAAATPGVAETRRVRVRTSGHQVFADVTVAAGRTASVERAHDIAEAVEVEIRRVAPGADVVVHVEPISEAGGLVERVQAAASRIDGVHEVHNVLVHAFGEKGRSKLHATLHAKVGPGVRLAEAHDVSDRIEDAVRAELGGDVRVDTHIEPLGEAAASRDVTEQRSDLVAEVRAAAREENDVIDCHEVVLTEAGGKVSVIAHVRARADLPLARIHAASEQIEKRLHNRRTEIGPVVIHFEPA